MQKLTVIRGLPGSGKSTAAKSIMDTTPDTLHFEADMFFVSPTTGEYRYVAELIHDAHAWCRTMTIQALERGFNVIVSNTFTTEREIEPYRTIAAIHSVELEILTCRGTFQNVHAVPDSVIDRMQNRWQAVEAERFI